MYSTQHIVRRRILRSGEYRNDPLLPLLLFFLLPLTSNLTACIQHNTTSDDVFYDLEGTETAMKLLILARGLGVALNVEVRTFLLILFTSRLVILLVFPSELVSELAISHLFTSITSLHLYRLSHAIFFLFFPSQTLLQDIFTEHMATRRKVESWTSLTMQDLFEEEDKVTRGMCCVYM
jgi:hypothetical protein